MTAGTSVSGICFSSSVCHLLWHGGEQFTVSLNGLSVVFTWTFSPVLFFFFCVLYCLFVCCLVFWGICYQFLNQQLLRNAEMDDCRIRALALFSFCVIWNIVLWVHIKCWDSLHKCLYLFICMCLNMITLWDTKLALKKKCRRLLLGQTVAFPLQSDILSCFDVHWKWIVGIFISVSRLLGM